MLRRRTMSFFTFPWAVAVFLVSTAACGTAAPPPPRENADVQVRQLADTFLAAYFDRYPEQATVYGVPGHRHDRLTDNSLAAQKAWEAREDAWLTAIKKIDPRTIGAAPLRATYAIVRQAIEGDVATRVCRSEVWNVSQMTGWQVSDGYLVTIQPVGSDDARKDALARWGALPRYIDTEIANLGEGLKLGYTAPKQNVRIVIDQVRSLASTPLKDSPFDSPSLRDKTPEFQKAFDALVADTVNPAATRYADYLEKEYLPAARDATAVAANPNGAACYDASVLSHSSSAKTAKEVHALGLQQIDQITAQMREIGERAFKTSDVGVALQHLRTDPAYKFKERAEKITYSQAALARAKLAFPRWLSLLPG